MTRRSLSLPSSLTPCHSAPTAPYSLQSGVAEQKRSACEERPTPPCGLSTRSVHPLFTPLAQRPRGSAESYAMDVKGREVDRVRLVPRGGCAAYGEDIEAEPYAPHGPRFGHLRSRPFGP